MEITSTFKLLGIEWIIILEDLCKKGKSPCSRVVDFLPFSFVRLETLNKHFSRGN